MAEMGGKVNWGVTMMPLKEIEGAIRVTPNGVTGKKYEVFAYAPRNSNRTGRWVPIDEYVPSWWLLRLGTNTSPDHIRDSWNSFVAGVAGQPSYYGIRFGGSQVHLSAFRLYNSTIEQITLPGNLNPSWGGRDQAAVHLARLLINESITPKQNDQCVTSFVRNSLNTLFLDNVVSRLPDEWTLTRQTIREWIQAAIEIMTDQSKVKKL